jgi:uncharacterized membrane protein YagU involved in acid resistance
MDKATLIGGLLAGILDLTDALIFYGNRGVRPTILLQSIASGWQGVDAYRGGLPSAVLGFVSHFLIALLAAFGYWMVWKSVLWVRRKWIQAGLIYGLFWYVFMGIVVIPASAFPNPVFPPVVTSVFLNGILAHALLVGLPIAWARKKLS